MLFAIDINDLYVIGVINLFKGFSGMTFLAARFFIRFMERLIKDSKRKILLILDNLKIHHSYIVKDWLEEHKEQIEVFFLPSYSPELNPDEYLNCDLKAGVHSEKPARKKITNEKDGVTFEKITKAAKTSDEIF